MFSMLNNLLVDNINYIIITHFIIILALGLFNLCAKKEY